MVDTDVLESLYYWSGLTKTLNGLPKTQWESDEQIGFVNY